MRDPDAAPRDDVTAVVFDQDAVQQIEILQPRRVRAPRSQRVVPAVIAVVVVLALVAVGAIVAGSSGGSSVAAPNMVGLSETDAAAAAARAGLAVQIQRQEGDDVRSLVVAQRPAAGAFLGTGGKVHIVVSRGPPPVLVPDIANQPVADAQAQLENLGFVVRIVRVYDEVVAKDAVISTDPAPGAKAPRESEIVLNVSDGPAPVPVPDVAGKTYDEAAAAVSAKGFKPVRADVFSETVESGKVVGTDPGVNQPAAKGGTVTIQVSKGPELVTIPSNVVGKTVEAASQQLQALGLVPDVENYGPGKTVRAISPREGTQVKKGSKVSLIL